MRKCGICKVTKSLEAFSFRNKLKGVRQWDCKQCHYAYVKAWKNKNKSRVLATAARGRDKHRVKLNATARALCKRNRKVIDAAKNTPCADCHIKYPPYVMDLDHVRGEKFRAVSQLLSKSLAIVLTELTKCDVVCSNCHRERTFHRGWPNQKYLE